MSQPDRQEQPFPRPLSGARVTPLPSARVPARATLAGRYVVLEPVDAERHAADLYAASHGTEDALRIWDFLPYGPWPDLAAYTDAVRDLSASQVAIFLAIRPVDREQVLGRASFMDIRPQNGVIEIGHIGFGRGLRRTPAATEALYPWTQEMVHCSDL